MSHTLLNTVEQQIEAREQGDKSVAQAAANPTAIQAAAKPDSEAKTPAVAAVKKGKKHMDKTDRPVDDDSDEGSSMPPDTQSGVKPPDTQSEAEATDDTQSEAEPTDTKSKAQPTSTRSGVQPTSTQSEAQPTATTSGAQPTATRSGARPTAARAGDTIESFSLKDLRGLRKDYTRRPDKSIITIIKRDETEETVLDIAKKLRTYANAMHNPTHAKITALKMRIRKLEDKIEENHKKLKKDILQISAVQVRGSGTKRKHSLNKKRKSIPRSKLLSKNPSAVGLLKVKEQQVPIATSTVHRRQYRTTQDAVIPIHKMIRELETEEVVSKTHSPFNSPIWPVRKSDGGWRLTVDYRALNEVTPPLSAAVPDMLELQYELESKAAK
ncbi:hypothetical protein DUI87_23824 [Hirundo rustica rustica]|uniref:Reverse transcriptase domain-containing protein n=1 Tax=Hirundo rustica rustica TaxID=333673 RepID=A0A3M0JF03_HIRRU|nr:hypothetical protein DUI87_23824 [Hirundo rustica rustica]